MTKDITFIKVRKYVAKHLLCLFMVKRIFFFNIHIQRFIKFLHFYCAFFYCSLYEEVFIYLILFYHFFLSPIWNTHGTYSPHQAKATKGKIMSTTIETITVTRPMKVRIHLQFFTCIMYLTNYVGMIMFLNIVLSYTH